MELQVEGIICIVIVLLILIYLIRNKTMENFIVLLEEVIIPKNCPNYLVTDGTFYYLMNTRLPYDGVTNPLKFESQQEANNYLSQNKCPSLEAVNLVVSKNKADPTDSYEKICAKDTATKIFNDDVCNQYGNQEQIQNLRNFSRDLMILIEKRNQVRSAIDTAKFTNTEYSPTLDQELEDINNQITNLRKQYANNDEALKEFVDYKVEDCMINTIKNENPNLDDSKFSDQFAKYFNQLNENIGQEYLYI